MKCCICGETIGTKEVRFYILVYKGDTYRKIYACDLCQEEFDCWIDAFPVDENNNLYFAPLEAKKHNHAN